MRSWVLGSMMMWCIVCLGCAYPGHSARQTQWRCQAEADAAVNRGDWDTALKRHQALVQVEPDNCLAIYHLGYILGKMGDRANEVIQYETAYQCGYDQDEQMLFNLAMAYGESGRTREAIDALEQAIDLNADNADSHYGLGLLLEQAGRLEAAMDAYAHALAVNQGLWDAHLALSRIYLDQGHLPAARVHLEVLQQAVPENDEVRRLWRLYQRRRATMYESQ